MVTILGRKLRRDPRRQPGQLFAVALRRAGVAVLVGAYDAYLNLRTPSTLRPSPARRRHGHHTDTDAVATEHGHPGGPWSRPAARRAPVSCTYKPSAARRRAHRASPT
jgi:hypothetical protein